MTRKYIVFLTFAVSLFMAANASAQYSHIKNIVGSDHDMSPTSAHAAIKTTSSFTEICFYCHIPHQTYATLITNSPLWNHQLSSVATYGVYSSPTFNALTTNITDLGTTNNPGSAVISNLCLSCHDGTVGVNVFFTGAYVGPGNGNSGFGNSTWQEPPMSGCSTGGASGTPCIMQGYAMMGNTSTGLQADHPINFTYGTALANQVVNLVQPRANGTFGGATAMGVPSKDGNGWLPLYTYGGNPTMQCATCHDVHDDTTNTDFLRATNNESNLCLSCHGA